MSEELWNCVKDHLLKMNLLYMDRKSSLVIRFNLQWKNTFKRNIKNRVSVVGMCDLSTSTGNLEHFKSYLLKNSGAIGDDVIVSYIGDEDKEFSIETQDDFQTALNYFREVARSGKSITLKLDSIFYKDKSDQKRSISSSEDSARGKDDVIYETDEENSSLNPQAPKWFTKYMEEFKSELVKEISSAVLKSVSNTVFKNSVSTNTPPENVVHQKINKKSKGKNSYAEASTSDAPLISRKKKLCKIILKAPGDSVTAEKNALKEHKLDQKLVKLENKSQKIKAKKAKLKTRLYQRQHNNSTSADSFGNEMDSLMGAVPVGRHETTIPRMLGGQVFEQEWKVQNTGQLPWTSETELHYAWGSEALRPIQLSYNCPYLKSGEIGTVKAQLKIPKKPGKYESYWYFHHLGRRFGHWLGCQVIVEPSPVKTKSATFDLVASNIEKSNANDTLLQGDTELPPWNRCPQDSPLNSNNNNDSAVMASQISKLIDDLKGLERKREEIIEIGQSCLNEDTIKKTKCPNDVNLDGQEKEPLEGKNMGDLGEKLTEMKIANNGEMTESSGVSDTDNQSIVSGGSETNSSTTFSERSEDFILVSKPTEEGDDVTDMKENNCDKKNQGNSSLLVLEIPSDDSEIEDYIKINKTIIPVPIVRLKKDEKKKSNAVEENAVKNDKISSVGGEKDNNGEVKEIEEEGNQRACITIDGKQFAVPKKFFRPEFLAKTEEKEEQTNLEASANKEENLKQDLSSIPMKEDELLDNAKNSQSIYVSASTTPDISLLSAQCGSVASNRNAEVVQPATETMTPVLKNSNGNSNNNRLFMFPQNCPGFEIIYNTNDPESFVGCGSDNGSRQVNNSYQPDFMAWLSHYSSPGTTTSTDHPLSSNTPLNYHYPTYTNTTGNYQSDGYQLQYSPYAKYEHQQQSYFNGFPQYPYPQYFVYDGTNANVYSPQTTEQQQNSYCPNETTATTLKQVTEDTNALAEELGRRSSSTDSFCITSELPRVPSNNTDRDRTPSIASETAPAQQRQQSNVSSSVGSNDIPNSPRLNRGIPQNFRESGFKGIIPVSENIVNGAVNVASSAINTARSVLSMFNPEPGTWVNGHWVPRNFDSKRERGLRILEEMGFLNRDYNATLLARYNDDITQVISEIVQ